MGRPTQHNHPPRPVRPPGGRSKRHASAMRYPNPTPAHPGRGHDQARQAWRRPQRQGHARTFPFPNPEAKTASADGTAPARVWESRTPPPAHHKRRGGPPRAPLSRAHTRTATPATPPHTHTAMRTQATVKPTRTHRASAHRTGHTGHREPHHKPRLLPAPHTPIAGMLVGPDLFALRHKGKNLLC